MPLNSKEIRRRIRSVESTKKITKAMEMVAAAKVRKAQVRVLATRPYATKLHEVFTQVTANLPPGEVRHPLLEKRQDANKTLLVLLTSDKGLCGGYNANIIRFGINRLRELKAAGRQGAFIVMGTKGVNFFKHSNFEVLSRVQNLAAIPTFTEAAVLIEEVTKLYLSGVVDRVELLYTRFHSLSRYEPTNLAILPATLPPKTPSQHQDHGAQTPYLFEPSAELLMEDLILAYLKTTVFQAMLEASASELANRMMAMGAASKNAGEMINHLTLVYNKARQAGITQEILEVVGGAEALKG